MPEPVDELGLVRDVPGKGFHVCIGRDKSRPPGIIRLHTLTSCIGDFDHHNDFSFLSCVDEIREAGRGENGHHRSIGPKGLIRAFTYRHMAGADNE